MNEVLKQNVLEYQRAKRGPLCRRCDTELDELQTQVCPTCGKTFDCNRRETINEGKPLRAFGRLALTPFGWRMHLATVGLAVIVLTPWWKFGNLGMAVAPCLILITAAIWLCRLIIYLVVGLERRQSWRFLLLPWRHALVFPLVMLLLLFGTALEIPLRLSMAVHHAQLGQMVADVQAGKPVVHQTMGPYDLCSDDLIAGCITFRIQETDQYLMYHPGGPPPLPRDRFWHRWGDWYEYVR